MEPSDKAAVARLLTFDEIPTVSEMLRRARELAGMARGFDAAMIGGAPYFMSFMENALRTAVSVKPLYSFSRRESVETAQPDGSVKKTAVFRHCGWVEV